MTGQWVALTTQDHTMASSVVAITYTEVFLYTGHFTLQYFFLYHVYLVILSYIFPIFHDFFISSTVFFCTLCVLQIVDFSSYCVFLCLSMFNSVMYIILFAAETSGCVCNSVYLLLSIVVTIMHKGLTCWRVEIITDWKVKASQYRLKTPGRYKVMAR